MAERVEREFKLRLPSEAALQALLTRLGGSSAAAVLQVNHFFDTADRALRRARIALRLREEQGGFTLSLKGPELEGEPWLAERPEEELALDAPTAHALLAHERSPLEVLGASELAGRALVRRALAAAGRAPIVALGSFENERVRVGPLPFPPGSSGPPLVFELDRTTFPGGSQERELEVELPEGAESAQVERALRMLLSDVGIAAESVPGKAARFFRILDALERGD